MAAVAQLELSWGAPSRRNVAARPMPAERSSDALYLPPDLDDARKRWRAMCGHGALAAALGVPVNAVRPYFDKGGWVNIPIMKEALNRSGCRWRRVDRPEAGQTGVALIQFLGPWSDPGVSPAEACRYRHWVAARGGLVWDVNWPEWQSHDIWKARLREELLPPNATGWCVSGAWLIE